MDLASVCVPPTLSIHEVVARIDRARSGAVVVTGHDASFLGVVTDGDIRRALLAHMDFSLPVQVLLDQRCREAYPEPVSALDSTTRPVRLAIMREAKVRHLPILDVAGRIVGFDRLDDLIEGPPGVSALVMAGGFGSRLRPLTDVLPKPLLPVGSRPILDYLVSHLASSGVIDVTIATHYRGELIRDHFGDGARWNVNIQYVDEQAPLGTAGALRLLPSSGPPVLVINGDILTKVDIGEMLRFHRDHTADLTIGLRALQTQVPYGVVEVRGAEVVGVLEKPTTQYFVNAGIYVVERGARDWLPPTAERVDMPDLVAALIADGRRVVGFPVREYWLDIGQPEHYAQAQVDVTEGRY